MIAHDRIEDVPVRRLIGLNGTFTKDTRSEIPALWDRWAYTTVTNVTRPDLVFGVSHNFAPGQFDYMCALEVSNDAIVPDGMTELLIPGGDYAVFVHDGHVSGIGAIFDAIICGDTKVDGYRSRPTPQLEVYGEGFDPSTATGLVELWFPVERG